MAYSDLTSPSGLLLLFIAACFDGVSLLIFIIEVLFDLGIIATITAYTGFGIVILLAWVMGYISFKELVEKGVEKAKSASKKGKTEKVSGSGDIKDWKLNKETGAYELQNNRPIEVSGSGNKEDWKQNKEGAYELQDKESAAIPETQPKKSLASKGAGVAKGLAKQLGWS